MKKIKRIGLLLFTILCIAMVNPTFTDQVFNVETVQAAAKLNKTKAILIKGQSLQLKVNDNSKKVTWLSSRKNVATVTSKGRVTARGKGITVITAKVGNKKYTCQVTVETPKLSKTSVSMYVGDKYNLKVTGTKQRITWSSNNKSVATVSGKGVVVAKKSGTAKITAKVGGKNYVCNVSVKTEKILFASTTDLAIKESGVVEITFKKTGTVHFDVFDENIVKCSWGEFSNDVIPLYFSGISNGTTTVTVTNSVNNERIIIKVTVSGKANVVENYKKLKKYINTYGYTNKYGNNFIKETYTPAGANVEVTVAIIYDNSENIFELLYYQDAYLIDVKITPTASPIFNVHAEANIYGVQIYSLDSGDRRAQYYDGDNLSFSEGRYNSKLITREEALDSARKTTDLAFSLSNIILLKSKIGIEWKDLGFSNFN